MTGGPGSDAVRAREYGPPGDRPGVRVVGGVVADSDAVDYRDRTEGGGRRTAASAVLIQRERHVAGHGGASGRRHSGGVVREPLLCCRRARDVGHLEALSSARISRLGVIVIARVLTSPTPGSDRI